MCPRCGKRVYFGKVASGQWVHVPGWHVPVAFGLCAGPLGQAEGMFSLNVGLEAQGNVLEQPAGMGPPGGAPVLGLGSFRLHLCYVPYCHLLRGWCWLNSCPWPTSVRQQRGGWVHRGRGDVPRGCSSCFGGLQASSFSQGLAPLDMWAERPV